MNLTLFKLQIQVVQGALNQILEELEYSPRKRAYGFIFFYNKDGQPWMAFRNQPFFSNTGWRVSPRQMQQIVKPETSMFWSLWREPIKIDLPKIAKRALTELIPYMPEREYMREIRVDHYHSEKPSEDLDKVFRAMTLNNPSSPHQKGTEVHKPSPPSFPQKKA